MAKQLRVKNKRTAQRIAQTVTDFEKQKFSSSNNTGRGLSTNFASWIVKTPSGGIPARSGTTAGKASCTIYLLDSSTDTLSSSDSVDVYNLEDTDVDGDIYIGAMRDKQGNYIADRAGGGFVSACGAVGYDGVEDPPPFGTWQVANQTHTGTLKEFRVLASPHTDAFETGSDTTTHVVCKKAGTYLFAISASFLVNKPIEGSARVGPLLIHDNIEFTYDPGSDKFVTELDNEVAAQGGHNPFLMQLVYPRFACTLYAYDSGGAVASGDAVSAELVEFPSQAMWEDAGTDSNGDDYIGGLWDFWLGGENNFSQHMSLVGAFGVDQGTLDGLTGELRLDLEIKSEGASGAEYDFDVGGHILHFDELLNISGDLISPAVAPPP